MHDRSRPAELDRSSVAIPHLLDALLSARGIWLFWLIYGVAFAMIRYMASRSLPLDDARESELAQWLALGYQTRQPPLFEWILWSVQQLTGPDIFSHLVVRYALFLASGVLAFGATRAITRDASWSAAASLSYAFAGFVGWAWHEWSTQSLLVSVACLATLRTTLAFLQNPSTPRAILLGLVIGFGLLSKYNYLLYLGGLALAGASLPETRARLRDRRLLISGLVAVACCAPYGWWLATVRGDLVRVTINNLVRSEQSHVIRALLGLGWLIVTIAIFLNVWPLMMAWLGWPAFRPARDRSPAPDPERIAARSIVFGTALTAIGVVIIGADYIKLHYVYPVLVTAPVYACARIARLAPGPPRARRVAATALAGAVLVFAVRLVVFFDNGVSAQLSGYREFAIPYDGLAAELGAQGFTEGTLVAAGVREAGNMRAYLPHLRVMGARDSFRVERPPRREGTDRRCALLWKEDEADWMRSWAQQDLGSATRLTVATSTIWGQRRGVWYYQPIDPRSPICS